DDTPRRFESYGWRVIRSVNGHDADEIKLALATARKSDRPTLICCKTIIGFGSPNKQGKESSHGAALGEDGIALTREALGSKHGPCELPEDIYAESDAREAGARAEQQWNEKFAANQAESPELAAEFKRRMAGELPADFEETASAF